MNWISKKILKHKGKVLITFFIAVVLSVFLSTMVVVDYDLMDYLPSKSPSTVSIEKMEGIYDSEIPNMRVLIDNVTIAEAMEYKEKMKVVKGVKEITWLDDSINIYEPLEIMDHKILENYYRDNHALFTLVVDNDDLTSIVNDIRSIIGENGAMDGEAVTSEYAESSTSREIQKIMVIAVPLIFIVLLLSTSSYFEPVLFLLTIGISILINMGTNVFLGKISFITNATAAILQLAVSMDYSIFLLHKFSEFREEGFDVKEAMQKAMVKSSASIVASGLTTILGFAALILMKYEIGPDMGVVLAKGVFLSLLSVMVLLPVFTVYTHKIIEKTHHRSVFPPFNKFSKFVLKTCTPIAVIVILLIAPSYLAQSHNEFNYGAAAMTENLDTKVGQDFAKINKIFGKSNTMVLVLPDDKPSVAKELEKELYKIPEVSSIVSYAGMVGNEIPKEFVPEDTLKQLSNKNYTRLVLSLSTDSEGEKAFKTVEEIRTLSGKYYSEYYLAGNSPSVYDMRDVVTKDNVVVTIASLIAIGLVILIIYRSLSLPIILLLTIEASIWINLSVSYFSGVNMNYLGYLVISSVQLGATVDYAILFANNYIDNRKKYLKKDAAKETIKNTTLSILTSALILTIAGSILSIICTNEVIAQLGALIARGAVLSAILVIFFLPKLLMVFDSILEKTTAKVKFYKSIDEKN